MFSYKYPIFSNKMIQQKLVENLDACRWLYNRLLQDLNEAKEKGIKIYRKIEGCIKTATSHIRDASFGDDVGSRAF